MRHPGAPAGTREVNGATPCEGSWVKIGREVSGPRAVGQKQTACSNIPTGEQPSYICTRPTWSSGERAAAGKPQGAKLQRAGRLHREPPWPSEQRKGRT